MDTLNQTEAILNVLMWLHNQSQLVRYAAMNDEDFAADIVSHFTSLNGWDTPRDQAHGLVKYPSESVEKDLAARAVTFCRQQEALLNDQATSKEVN